MLTANVNKIIPLSMVDGPGNRCSIFFQGCNFNCKYCHNPETINMCNSCGLCIPHCEYGAIKKKNGKVIYNKELCVNCDSCIKACPRNSSPKIVKYTVDELFNEIKKYSPFITGITTSGGECSLRYEFIAELFRKAKTLNLNCLADTNGGLDFSNPIFSNFISQTDGFMLDVKAFNDSTHVAITGQDGEIVFKNLKYLAEIGKLDEVRTVLLDSVDNEKIIREIGKILSLYLKEKSIRYKLISYRPFGVRDEYLYLRGISEQEKIRLQKIAQSYGFTEVILI